MCVCVNEYCGTCVSAMTEAVRASTTDQVHPDFLPSRKSVVETLERMGQGPFDAADITFLNFVRWFCYSARSAAAR